MNSDYARRRIAVNKINYSGFQDVLIDRRSLFDCTEAPAHLKAPLAAFGAVGGLDLRQRLPHPVQLSNDGSPLRVCYRLR
jgi:hypothetical protein